MFSHIFLLEKLYSFITLPTHTTPQMTIDSKSSIVIKKKIEFDFPTSQLETEIIFF